LTSVDEKRGLAARRRKHCLTGFQVTHSLPATAPFSSLIIPILGFEILASISASNNKSGICRDYSQREFRNIRAFFPIVIN
jgi:hypothetical protein